MGDQADNRKFYASRSAPLKRKTDLVRAQLRPGAEFHDAAGAIHIKRDEKTAHHDGLPDAVVPFSPDHGGKPRREESLGSDFVLAVKRWSEIEQAENQPTKDAMDLAYLAGQRPQDTLLYEERDIRENFLHIDQGKTGKKLRMEVSADLLAVLTRIRARKAGYKVVSTALVVNEKGQRMTLDTLQRRFRKARRRAGVPDREFQIRDLRAKAGTDKTDSSGDIRQAQKQLGHTSVTMTEHYVRNRRGDKVKPTK